MPFWLRDNSDFDSDSDSESDLARVGVYVGPDLFAYRSTLTRGQGYLSRLSRLPKGISVGCALLIGWLLYVRPVWNAAKDSCGAAWAHSLSSARENQSCLVALT